MVPRLDLALELFHLAIELTKMTKQSTEELAACAGQTVLGILQDLRHLPRDATDSFRKHDAKLSQQASDLIGLRGARGDKTLAMSLTV